MPLVWRVIMVLDELTKGWEEPFTFADLVYSYEIKVRNGRYTCYMKKQKDPLVMNTGVIDRFWKEWFIFISKASLGEKGYFLQDGWPKEEANVGLVLLRRKENTGRQGLLNII